jgi:small membrane protein
VSAFQYIVTAVLVLLGWTTVRAAARGGIRKRIATFWLLIWSAVGVAALWPRSTLIVARALGIGRGADLVMYSSVLAMLVGFFYIYTRFRRMDRSLTLLVRRLAVDNPVLPEAGPPPLDGREPSTAAPGASSEH